eukprot:IDg15388t1
MELFIGNLKETVIPIALSKWRGRKKAAAAQERKKQEAAAASGGDPDLQGRDILGKPAEVEVDPLLSQLEMEPYEGVFDDYFELVRQFSQITLFAAAFPLGAALAALNNCMEIKADSYKLVHMTRRATPRRALNIGAWIRAFEFLSITSIMTNLGIITVTASYARAVVGSVSPDEEFFWMLVIEHLLLVVRFVFMAVVEGIPSWVRTQRAKERYRASRIERIHKVALVLQSQCAKGDTRTNGDLRSADLRGVRISNVRGDLLLAWGSVIVLRYRRESDLLQNGQFRLRIFQGQRQQAAAARILAPESAARE